jgi:dipeptidase E
MAQRLLLLSTSTLFGGGYLEYAEAEIRDFLADVERVLFVPFALHDRDAYTAKVQVAFSRFGYGVDSVHSAGDMHRAVEQAQAVFIGGGNTFRLLKALYDHDLLGVIRQRVQQGLPYIGSSAGSNVAGPTIRTTNDMPIVQPPSFDSLGLIPFQLNPHYLDADPNSTHMGETREERLLQYLEENETPVLGLREGAWIRQENATCTLGGAAGARLFRRGVVPEELTAGAALDALML